MTRTSTCPVLGDPIDVDLEPLGGPLAAVLADPDGTDSLHTAGEAARWSARVAAVVRRRRMRLAPVTSQPLAPVAVWAVGATVALAMAQAHVTGALAVGVVGALVALLALGGSLPLRLATAVAMAPVAFAATAPRISWVLAGALVAGLAATAERPLIARVGELQRHLDWCRRREESAHVLVVMLPGAENDHRRLLEAFRLTDSVAIQTHREGCEVHAVIDDHRLSRAGLERRIVQEVGDDARFGWAAFPQDGYTLEVLLERAASGLTVSDHQRATALGRLDSVQQPA